MVTEDGNVKIIDFGIVTYNPDDHRVKGKQGTYHTPESLTKDYHYLGPKDIWAFGAIAHYCLSKSMPFDMEKRHIADRINLPDETPAGLKTLIERCLRSEPSERPNADVLCMELERALQE